MGDEYEQLKKCFDLEKIKNSQYMNEINNLKENLSDYNSEFSRISEKTIENQSRIYLTQLKFNLNIQKKK